MSVPPFVLGALGLLVAVNISDRYRQRAYVAIVATCISTIGLIVMEASNNPRLRYGFTNICLMGTFVGGPLGLAWIIVGPDSLTSFALTCLTLLW